MLSPPGNTGIPSLTLTVSEIDDKLLTKVLINRVPTDIEKPGNKNGHETRKKSQKVMEFCDK